MAYHADPVQRLMTSFKFTLGFLIVMGVIMCIGAFALNTDGQWARGTPYIDAT